ncbi:hypothetical protein CWIS_13590 [Cellulomonas sp. A375-1]|uniref:hypothetical protein n=1 Tax=Cellulomonas sp. A375-1 TaxID=1672219 RepID=UPI00065266C5|nr:hypothetical protein [Cellulomonas sp. A375-1]KMM44862.1 hypothetical protein CWIS_13590 [Cellulomonas sp. A375-1]
MSGLEDFFVHTVTVESLTGSGGEGDVFAAPATVPCFVEDKRQLVRGPDGREVIAETTVYAPAGTTSLTPGSRVTLPSRSATVITSAALDGGALGLPAHVVATLT